MPPECDNCSLFGFGQDRLPRFFRTRLHVLYRRPLPPPGYRPWIDAQFLAQRRERTLRSLYCGSDGVRGRGAPVTNLSHAASFHSRERIAPSHRGIKHLTYAAREMNWANGHSPGVNWPSRIMFATSIPSSVAEAATKDLKPNIGRTSFLIVRWSCSIMLLRYAI